MQERVESTGRTVEEALERALAVLGSRRDAVRWDVVDHGGARLLGLFGTRPARVWVERLAPGSAPAAAAGITVGGSGEQIVRDLLAAMGITARVEIRHDAERVDVAIVSEDADGLLIGRRGETLAALQHVVGRLLSKQCGFSGTVAVDVGGYRQRREALLADKARVLAAKVQTTGRPIHFEPLHAHDRRIVHGALSAVSGVRTYAVGRGSHRSIVIAPTDRPPAATLAP